MLRMLQQLKVSRRRRFETDVLGDREGFERMTGAIGAQILRHRALYVLHRHRGTPGRECRRHRRQRIRHKQVGLQSFDRGRLARERQHDIGQEVERETPENAVQKRRQIGAEQGLRTQRRDAEWTVLQQHEAGGVAVQEAWKKQRIAPYGNTDQHAPHGASRGRARDSAPRCSTSGTMISFETMIESATHSTITMAVAADRPPTKTPTLSKVAFPSIGNASTYMSLSTAPNGNVTKPASAIGITNRLMATR